MTAVTYYGRTIKVVLSGEQVTTCYSIAKRRIDYAKLTGRRATHGGLEPDAPGALRRHQLGACSEYATAWALNLFWHEHVGDLDALDVGDYAEVRYVEDDRRRLILHKDSSRDAPFVSVLAKPPVFILRGFIVAKDGQREENWQDPSRNNRWAYFPKNSELRPMSELQTMVALHRVVSLPNIIIKEVDELPEV